MILNKSCKPVHLIAHDPVDWMVAYEHVEGMIILDADPSILVSLKIVKKVVRVVNDGCRGEKKR